MTAPDAGKQDQSDQTDKDTVAKQKRQVDPFWLRTRFPDPTAIISLDTPSVSGLFADSLIVFDTNALLAPYQVSKHSADEIGRIYRDLAKYDRLFVSEQAIREFGKNRGVKLQEMCDAVHKLTDSLPKAKPIDCPMLEDVAAYAELFLVTESIDGSLKKYKELVASLKMTLAEWTWTDRVSKLYKEVFTPARIVGHDISDDDFLKQLASRYENQIPPGYKDKSKPDSGMGDLAIWFSILKLAKTKKKHIVFVCNETKHDWLYTSGDQSLTPRIELCLEFNRDTGQHFGMVSWPRFLELAGARSETVRDAKRANHAPVPQEYDLMPIVMRLTELISDLGRILRPGPIDSGSGYARILDLSLYPLIEKFALARRAYMEIMRPPIGSDFLESMEDTLGRIRMFNRQLEAMEVRMKASGDAETAGLADLCVTFEFLAYDFKNKLRSGGTDGQERALER